MDTRTTRWMEIGAQAIELMEELHPVVTERREHLVPSGEILMDDIEDNVDDPILSGGETEIPKETHEYLPENSAETTMSEIPPETGEPERVEETEMGGGQRNTEVRRGNSTR